MSVKGTIEYVNSPKASMAKVVQATKAGAEAAVEYWHESIMPDHFEPAAAKKYNYQPRTKRYQIRKGRQKKHQRPLVWSGDSERRAKMMVKVSSRKRDGNTIEGIAAMPALPKYFYQRRKDHNAPDKPKELTTATADETLLLGGILSRVAMREITEAPQRQTVRTQQ